jgi:hypothetical protein
MLRSHFFLSYDVPGAVVQEKQEQVNNIVGAYLQHRKCGGENCLNCKYTSGWLIARTQEAGIWNVH